MIEDQLIDEIREVRKKISNQFNNNPKLLVNYYIEMQKKRKSNLVVTDSGKTDSNLS